MKHFLLFCVLACPVLLMAQQSEGTCSDPETRQSIKIVIEEWRDGYNHGHASQVAALYSNDAYYLTQHYVTGIVQGRRAIQAYVQRGIDARYHVDSIRIISADCSARNFAYVITRYDATNGDQKAFGVNLVVLKKSQGKWLIVAHEAAVPDAATAVQSLDIR
jgi:uncharacterized protein (TIGR02246 family)